MKNDDLAWGGKKKDRPPDEPEEPFDPWGEGEAKKEWAETCKERHRCYPNSSVEGSCIISGKHLRHWCGTCNNYWI